MEESLVKFKELFLDISATTIVAWIGLVVSMITLLWNIIRDLIKDRMNVNVRAEFGGLHPISEHKGIFVEKGTSPDFPTLVNPMVLISIVNMGRRPVMIFKLGGAYTYWARFKKHVLGKEFVLPTINLPKKLEPYEFYSEQVVDINLQEQLKKGYVGSLFAIDTKGKKWKISCSNRKKLMKNILN